MKQGKESLHKKVGDKIERAGKKISAAGAEKIGKAVYKAGDKLEHAGEHRTTRRADSPRH